MPVNIKEFSAWLIKQDDHEPGKYLSGSYGKEKRDQFLIMLKLMAARVVAA